MKKIFYFLIALVVFASCGSEMDKKQVEGCWSVSFIDTDGVRVKSDDYEMCFESSGDLISRKKDGSQKVNAEWSFEKKDSTIIAYFKNSPSPDTMKIIKIEENELHLRMKKKFSTITIYLRKKK